ncbi:MAG TPA: hypothetical protein VM936_15125 [Pyrinomonadaceae bacterium]|jgi:hypothetical protein|nr:hypothetical protein [Pyrinomonadaceae bacterium]
MSLRKLYAPALLFSLTLLFAPRAAAQTADARAQAAAEIASLRAQIKAKEPALLSTAKEDRRAHAAFLAQPGTGLVRLLPREKWDGVLSTRGGGAYYSFTRLRHEYDYGTNIGFEQGRLSARLAGASFGFLTNLGDTPLETVTAETEAVQFMASYKVPTFEPDARKSQMQFMGAGYEAGGAAYKDTMPVSVGSTYALRSVEYKNSDVLVAFRVVRKDSDGSIVLLWKMLQEFPKPELQRNVAAAGGR